MAKGSAGFSIIEIIFLVAIAGLVLAGIGSLWYSMIRMGESNQSLLLATRLAEDVMEELRGRPYSELKEWLSEGELTLNQFYDGSFPSSVLSNFPQVEQDLSKIKMVATSEEGMEVEVSIKWKEAGTASEREYRVASYFLEGGLNDYLAPAQGAP